MNRRKPIIVSTIGWQGVALQPSSVAVLKVQGVLVAMSSQDSVASSGEFFKLLPFGDVVWFTMLNAFLQGLRLKSTMDESWLIVGTLSSSSGREYHPNLLQGFARHGLPYLYVEREYCKVRTDYISISRVERWWISAFLSESETVLPAQSTHR